MDDYSLMPFGKYKGIELISVPAEYLLEIYKNGKATGELKEYIEDYEDALNLEMQSKLN
jgi:uncharacterized protein (DUF3820 family)